MSGGGKWARVPAKHKPQAPEAAVSASSALTQQNLFAGLASAAEVEEEAPPVQERAMRKSASEHKLKKKETAAKQPIAPRTRVKKRSSSSSASPVLAASKSSFTPGEIQDLVSSWNRLYGDADDAKLSVLADQLEEVYGNSANLINNDRETADFWQRIEMPASLINDRVCTAIVRFIDSQQASHVVPFFWMLVEKHMSTYEGKRRDVSSGKGHKLLIQLLARSSHAADILRHPNSVETYGEAITSSSAPYGDALVWLFAQFLLLGDHALLLWYQFLLPPLCDLSTPERIRHNIVLFLDRLLELNSLNQCQLNPVSKGNESLVASSLEQLAILASNTPSNSTPINSTRIIDMYNKLITISLWSSPTKRARYFFPSFLAQAAASHSLLRSEAFSSLIKCLACDPVCLQLWVKIYPRHIAQSNNLVLYMSENWSALRTQLLPHALLDTVNAFMAINKQMLSGNYLKKSKQGKSTRDFDPQDVQMCNITLKSLRKSLLKATNKSSWTSLWLPISFALLVAILYGHCHFPNFCSLDVCSYITDALCPTSSANSTNTTA